MEIQEMIDVLRDISNINLLSCESYKRNTISAVIEILEKQVPKCPQQIITYICPNPDCEERIYGDLNYCPKCFQALSWDTANVDEINK